MCRDPTAVVHLDAWTSLPTGDVRPARYHSSLLERATLSPLQALHLLTPKVDGSLSELCWSNQDGRTSEEGRRNCRRGGGMVTSHISPQGLRRISKSGEKPSCQRGLSLKHVVAHVTVERILERELHAADLAAVGPLSRVGAHVAVPVGEV